MVANMVVYTFEFPTASRTSLLLPASACGMDSHAIDGKRCVHVSE